MNDTLENIWTFRTANFTVKVDADIEYDLDTSWDETGEIARDIESGTLQAFSVHAYVTDRVTGDRLADDYLGNCIYKRFDDFKDLAEVGRSNKELRAKGSDAVCGSYFSDMVRTVCSEARDEIQLRATHYAALTA